MNTFDLRIKQSNPIEHPTFKRNTNTYLEYKMIVTRNKILLCSFNNIQQFKIPISEELNIIPEESSNKSFFLLSEYCDLLQCEISNISLTIKVDEFNNH